MTRQLSLVATSVIALVAIALAAPAFACNGVCYRYSEDEIEECCKATMDYEGISNPDGITVCMPNGSNRYNCTDLTLIGDNVESGNDYSSSSKMTTTALHIIGFPIACLYYIQAMMF